MSLPSGKSLDFGVDQKFSMSGLVRTVLALLMALTLNASMALAASAHAPAHHAQAAVSEPCGHHEHETMSAGQDQASGPDSCIQQACPSCLGLPLTIVSTGEVEAHMAPEPLPAAQGSAAWRSSLLRPPIHI